MPLITQGGRVFPGAALRRSALICFAALSSTVAFAMAPAIDSGSVSLIASRTSQSTVNEADLTYAEAMEFYRKGEYEKAQVSGERALQLREQALGAEHAAV